MANEFHKVGEYSESEDFIFDENKSVKWNRKQVIDSTKKYDKQLKDFYTEK